MNKSELVARVATKTGHPPKVVSTVVEAVFDSITDTVAAGDTAAFVGFGTFAPAKRAERPGRNPRTGETLQLAARMVPKFSPGTAFKAKVKNGS